MPRAASIVQLRAGPRLLGFQPDDPAPLRRFREPPCCCFSGCARRAPEASGAAPFKMTVQLDWVAEPEHGGIYQALAKGYFREAGLDVTVVPGGANAFVMQKLATDKADIGQSDSTNTLLAIAQGCRSSRSARFSRTIPRS